MGEEKRKTKRLDLNISMKVNTLKEFDYLLPVKDEFEVEVINISKEGIAFKSKEKIMLNSFFNANVVLWTKETFESVIEIIRMENTGEEETLYGCRFIGISSADQFKIDVYQIVRDMEN